MKVLFSGAFNPAFEALPESLADALRDLGHRVVVFDHRAFLVPGRIRARAAALDRWDRDRLNRRFVDVARRERPDVALVNQGMTLAPETIERARGLGVRCVNWFSDFPAEFEESLRAAPAYDAFHVASSWAAERHREAGHARAAWLPFGCDPARHHPDPAGPGAGAASRRPPDVVFVGSWYPERQILLRFLRGLDVGVWGPGWERAAADPHVGPMIRGGALRPDAWRALYAGCRVALNVHHGSFGPDEVSGRLANVRVFEILGCGAYQVVDRPADVLRLFRAGTHLDTYASGDELRDVVARGLRDEGRRLAVARAGHAEAMAHHTYRHRARVLLGEAAFAAGDAGPAAAALRAAGGTR